MSKTKLPAKVSKWEIGGVPAAAILEILYEMESLPEVVRADLPRYMLLAFIVVALVRAYHQRKVQSATLAAAATVAAAEAAAAAAATPAKESSEPTEKTSDDD